ncbi:uncharacterized protein [Hetaerina americana]|uniref:uncharacterized protein n=1 Tax=Hetaerina americana TaxID=62018 RepID=UPI003A7F376B
MGCITPADNKGRATIPPPTPREIAKNTNKAKLETSFFRDSILLPILSMALLITIVSPEPLPQTTIDPSVTSTKNLCSLGWCNCTRINEVPQTAEVAAVSYGRRGYSYVDSLRPVFVKDGLKVLCFCSPEQELILDHNSLPPETLELEVSGCAAVRFKAGSLSRTPAIASLHLRSSGRVSFKRNLYIPPPPTGGQPVHSRLTFSRNLSFRQRISSDDRPVTPRLRDETRSAESQQDAGGRHERSAQPAPRTPPPSRAGMAPVPSEVRLDVGDCQSVSWESGAFRTGGVVGTGSSMASQGGSDAAANIAAVRPRPPLSVRLQMVGHVLVDSTSFGRLNSFHASNVSRLELREYAFSVESTPEILDALDGPQRNGLTTTQVTLRDVTVPWVPRHAFPSSSTMVVIESSQVHMLRRDAFSALTFSGIVISNVKIGEVESGAFSGRTLCFRLALHNVSIRKLSHIAIHSAVSRFSITNSWITQVSGGAFNLTVATANITDNVFEVVRSRGFSLRDWDRVRLHNNTFLRLDPGSFSSLIKPYSIQDHDISEDLSTSSSSSPLLQVYSHLSGSENRSVEVKRAAISSALSGDKEMELDDDPYERAVATLSRFKRVAPVARELNITENVFGDTVNGALSLLPHLNRGAQSSTSQEDDDGKARPVAMIVSDNRFRSRCRCGMVKWLRGLTAEQEDTPEENPSPYQWSYSLYNTSMCLVDNYLARCFNVSVGFMRMRDFATLFCPAEDGGEMEGDGGIEAKCDAMENPVGHKPVTVVPDTAAGAGGVVYTNLDEEDEDLGETELERDKKILNTIFVAVVICICIIVTVTWIGRSNWWKRMRERRQMTVVERDEAPGCWTWMVLARLSSGLVMSRRVNGAVIGGKGRVDGDEDGISGADSITRLSVDGYNEMREREDAEKGTAGKRSLPRMILGEAEGSGLLGAEGDSEEGEEDDVEREDKATQTMPEELTQELLMALREKLDDPENYSEARDMIEHLYDMIKVEEERELEEKSRMEASRRGRSVGTTDDEEDEDDEIEDEDDDDEPGREENLYDVIQPPKRENTSGQERKCGRRRRGRHREARSYNSVGTRAPSPDKLEPVLAASASMASLASIASLVSPLGSPMPRRGTGKSPRKRRPAPKAPAVCEYVEPRDRAQHVYTELPVNGLASNCDPRPPRLRMKDEQAVQEKPDEDKASGPPPPPPNTPFKLLRSLGETFLTPNKPPRPPPPNVQKPPEVRVKSNGGIVCEYTEPTDAKVHVYTELPVTVGQTGSPPSQNQLPISMANRPLPHKPDSPDSPKPSTSFALR